MVSQNEGILPAPRNLAEGLWIPGTGATQERTREIILTLLGSLVIVGMAQIAIPLPFTPVPITGQTFAVLLVGMALGPRLGAAAALAYLVEGAAGLPVFAGGSAGIAKFVGPTAGYLFAYPLAAALVGWLAERGWDRKPLTTALGMFLGSLIILGLGTAVLSFFVGGLVPALAKGLLPFLPGDVVKTTLAALTLPGAWAVLGKKKPKNP